ncbi:MAG TPA: dihydrofolate reductase family protein, partial [Labilithrix sp.]|nr:dihydrofolate reductase family protein [Labilithrix sp.]
MATTSTDIRAMKPPCLVRLSAVRKESPAPLAMFSVIAAKRASRASPSREGAAASSAPVPQSVLPQPRRATTAKLESARPIDSSLERGAMVTSDMLTRCAGFNQENAWALLLALARRAGSGTPVVHDTAVRLREDGSLEEDAERGWIVARPSSKSGWSSIEGVTAEDDVARLLDIYMPLCVGGGSDALTIAHLAQTLDGRVAIASGHSQFITGDEDLVHSHRLRALCDVVIVGRRTVEQDDPLLTTRRC